jgi:hypothetical protein
LLERLVRIAGEHALVEVLGRAQRRPVAEQHVEELEALDMAAEHDEAERQRRRDEEPDRPPEPGPEDRRDNDRERRQAGALAIDERLDDVAHERLGDDEQRRRPQHHRPAGIDGGGEPDRQQRRDEGADIGHEAQQRRENAPQHRARHADDPQPGRGPDPEGGVERELGEVEAREPARRVVHGGGGAVQVARPEQPDHAVAQILALEQDEDQHHEGDAEHRQRVQDRRDEALRELERREIGLADLDRQRLLRLGRGLRRRLRRGRGRGLILLRRPLDLASEVPHPGRQAAEDAFPQPADLVTDRLLVARQVARELGHLQPHDRAEGADHAERDEHRDDDREHPSEPQPAHEIDERREHEGEQHREHDRQEHVAPEIQRRDRRDPDEERHQARKRRRLGRRDLVLGRRPRP